VIDNFLAARLSVPWIVLKDRHIAHRLGVGAIDAYLHQQSQASCGSGAVLGDLAEILGVLQLNVRAKRCIEHFSRFWLRILRISHRLFDADDLMALGALAETMTGAIHFVLWSKPTYVGQFWFFHSPSVPQAGDLCQPQS
jgi:hypothetical protein